MPIESTKSAGYGRDDEGWVHADKSRVLAPTNTTRANDQWPQLSWIVLLNNRHSLVVVFIAEAAATMIYKNNTTGQGDE